MNTETTAAAWLETDAGQILPIDGATTLGRSASANRHAFPHAKVSTRHALIHTQEGGEFWLVDRGSTNGTLLNDERLIIPTCLRDSDRINLGHGVALVFRQPLSAEAMRSLSMLQQTAAHTYEERRWLLIADLVGFSAMGKTVTAPELAHTVGRWLAAASDLLAHHGGRVNKYTGDGFLAFWRDRPDAPAAIAAALLGFRSLAAPVGMSFRIVLHVGTVAIGGAPSLGEESLMSDDLSFTFRLEKAAAALETPVLLSAAAAAPLRAHLSLRETAYDGELKGFPGPHTFFAA